jgi:ribosomal protein S18 acetylase RimI-like enzyme
MAPSDLATVEAIAARVHPDYPESLSVFEERLRLYPSGCYVCSLKSLGESPGRLSDTPTDVVAYVISHPWIVLQPPPLNSLLGQLPASPSTYYLHDIALLPEARGTGAARTVVQSLISHATSIGAPTMSLVAVNASHRFWAGHDFAAHEDAALTAKLRSYDADAQLMIRSLI